MSIAELPEADAATTPEQRIAELEATVAKLVERLERVDPATNPAPSDAAPELSSGSRRNLFKLAAGAAAGGTALALSKTGPVAAADNGSLTIGDETTQGDSGPTTTVLRYVDDGLPEVPNAGPIFPNLGPTLSANIVTVRDTPSEPLINPDSSGYPSALAGYGLETVQNGVYGVTAAAGYGVVGRGTGAGTRGVLAIGERANLELLPSGPAPRTRTDFHVAGEMVADANRDLWFCTSTGTPGTWRKLAGTATAGTFHAVTPFRVYDSRQVGEDGLPGGEEGNYTVSVEDALDVETNEVATAGAVPEGATAISANIVAINTIGRGFVTVNPGGDIAVGAAALNWDDGQTVGNAGIFKISASRELSVLVRGDTTIDLTIDVTGYWL